MKNIQLLDCTLRDGGHLNDGKFGEDVIKYTIQKLVEANTDIIEFGFLWDKEYGTDTARYFTIADAKRVLPKERGHSRFSLMADFIDLNHLEPYDGTVDFIRLSFKRHRLEWALNTLKVLKDKGYKVFINPVNCNVYTDKEYLSVIEKVNELKPYGFSMVDTFGVMRLSDLSARYYLVEKNLDPSIAIGLHLHENLGLAYSLAQRFIEISSPKRNIVIDGSLLGMGRVPGNLPIEQIMDHVNANIELKYNLAPVYDAIDDYIAPIKKEISWGYSIPYALSAQNHLHRTYAEYLMGKWKLKTSDIEDILKRISAHEAEMFNEEYVESLYREYLDVKVDDASDNRKLKQQWEDKTILIVAPGPSIRTVEKEIKAHQENGTVIISVNFIPDFVSPDYVIFTNVKRYETETMRCIQPTNIIITSNLIRNVSRFDFAVQYGALACHDDIYHEDSVLMLLNLLKRLGIKEVSIAGFDGYRQSGPNFYTEQMDRQIDGEYKNVQVNKILQDSYCDMELHFLTPSQFNYCSKE